MADPSIRSQSSRQNLGTKRLPSKGKAGAAGGTPSDTQVAEALLRSSGPTGSRERLNNFLTKLETTWKLFNRSSEASGKGELPEEGQLALLNEGEAPTPETLKEMRARFKQQAQKPQKGPNYLTRSSMPEQQKATQKKAPGQGPKQSPMSDRNTPQPPTQRQRPPGPQAKSQPQPAAPKPQAQAKPKPQPKPAPTPRPKPQSAAPQPKEPPKPARPPQRFEAPRVQRQAQPQRSSAAKGSGKGSVLGRKPGSSKPSSAPKSPTPQGQAKEPMNHSGPPRRASASTLGKRRPTLLRTPNAPRGPAGQPTSKSFLGTSTQANAQLRSSDAAGRPGKATLASPARQAVFSQSVAQVNPRLTKRQVSGQMPIHSSFLDECHEGESKDTGPIKLSWTAGKRTSRTPAQRMFSHRQRLQLSRRGGGKSLGNPISMKGGQASLASARTDVSTRVAGAAIGSLLEDLYDEEDVENLDEETAVTSLSLILRLGGEFTYNHSTRVLDLALELADEVGIRDKQTRKEIKFGTMLRDVGEFDLLLQGGEDKDKRMKEFSGFLAGQDMLRAGLLHDIGKVGIPPEILYKPGKLTPEEYEIMKMHPIYGEEIVRPIASLRYLCPTIRGHHERWDGKGYPDELSGEDIPLAARIISVADVFDALAAERPYKRGMEVKKVKSILAEGRGTHFDPFLVDAFLDVINRRYPESV